MLVQRPQHLRGGGYIHIYIYIYIYIIIYIYIYNIIITIYIYREREIETNTADYKRGFVGFDGPAPTAPVVLRTVDESRRCSRDTYSESYMTK